MYLYNINKSLYFFSFFLFKGDTSKEGKVAIAQSKLKPDITNTFGDSDIETRSSLPFEDLTQFAVSSQNTVGPHI